MTRQHSIAVASIAALLAACGGSSGSSSGNTPPATASQVTRGAITSISTGSMVVNGVTFSTSATTKVRVEGVEKVERPETELRHGMVVRVKGNHANRAGEAAEIEFEDHVKGRVRSTSSTPTSTSVDVGGRTVHVEDDTRLVDDRGVDITPSDIGPDDRVRISGFADDQGRLRATSVERQRRNATSDDSFEAKGFVKSLNTARTQFTLISAPADAAGIAVTLGSGVSLPAAVVEGSFVEVRSASALSGNAITASSVSLEDRHEAEGDEVEVEGIVVSGTAADFVIAGQRVTTSAATRWEFGTAADFVLGVKLEAEGHIASGALVAEKVSFRYNVKIEAPVAAVTASSLTVLGLPVTFSELTRTENSPVNGSTFEIRGFVKRNATGDVTGVSATRIRARSGGGGGGGGGVRYLWQGPVDAKNGTSTLTILGVTVTTAGASFLDHKQSDTAADVPLTRDAFFAKVTAGRSVVKARLNADPTGSPLSAPADELELEDEPSGHK